MLRNSKPLKEYHEEDDDRITSSEFLSANEMEFEIAQDSGSQKHMEMEIYVDKSKLDLVKEEDILIPLNGDDGLYKYFDRFWCIMNEFDSRLVGFCWKNVDFLQTNIRLSI